LEATFVIRNTDKQRSWRPEYF